MAKDYEAKIFDLQNQMDNQKKDLEEKKIPTGKTGEQESQDSDQDSILIVLAQDAVAVGQGEAAEGEIKEETGRSRDQESAQSKRDLNPEVVRSGTESASPPRDLQNEDPLEV